MFMAEMWVKKREGRGKEKKKDVEGGEKNGKKGEVEIDPITFHVKIKHSTI